MGWKPEKSGIAGIIGSRIAPGISGNARGPGSRQKSRNFNIPQPYEETRDDLRRLEEKGYFKKHPELAKPMKAKLNQLREIKKAGLQPDIDYTKQGHPLRDKKIGEAGLND